MLGWMLRQTIFILLLFMLLIIGMMIYSRGKSCLCVSLHVQVEDRTEFRFLDVATGSTYTLTQHDFLGQSALNQDEQFSYTYQDKTIALPPENAGILADRSPTMTPDSPWLAYLPPIYADAIQSDAAEPVTTQSHHDVYFVLYSFTVGDAVLHEVHLLDPSAGQLRRLFAARFAIASLSWSDDYQSVFALTSNRDIVRLNSQTGTIEAQWNIQDILAEYGNVTNARISNNADWVLFIVGTDNLVLHHLPTGYHTQLDLNVQRVINAIWWEHGQL